MSSQIKVEQVLVTQHVQLGVILFMYALEGMGRGSEICAILQTLTCLLYIILYLQCIQDRVGWKFMILCLHVRTKWTTLCGNLGEIPTEQYQQGILAS